MGNPNFKYKLLTTIILMVSNVSLSLYLGLKLMDLSRVPIPKEQLGAVMNIILVIMVIIIFINIFISTLIFWGYLKLFKFNLLYSDILVITNIIILASVLFKLIFINAQAFGIFDFIVPLVITNLCLNRKLDKKFLLVTTLYYLLNSILVMLLAVFK